MSRASNTLVSTPSSQNGLETCSGLKRKSIDEPDEDEQEAEAKKNNTTARGVPEMGLPVPEKEPVQVDLRCDIMWLSVMELPYMTSEELPHPATHLLPCLWEGFQIG